MRIRFRCICLAAEWRNALQGLASASPLRMIGCAAPQALRTSPVPASHGTAPPFWQDSTGLLAIICLVDQCSDQSQQLLLLKTFALTEEHSDLDVGHMPS